MEQGSCLDVCRLLLVGFLLAAYEFAALVALAELYRTSGWVMAYGGICE